ncbi:MAG TPA: hypothetical protein VFX65_02380 [Candidatus Limnocylindrales bacterium]|nr:hypothetical protein [Candidatus Limnocylindrales bacterium]
MQANASWSPQPGAGGHGLARRAPLAIVALLVAACTSGTSPAPTGTPGGTPALPSGPATASPTLAPGATAGPTTDPPPALVAMSTFGVPAGSHPHDVAPAADGGIWYTAQATGTLGWLDPVTRDIVETRLGSGSAPHGVIVGPDDAAWVTDSGLNAIVRVDGTTRAVTAFPLDGPDANLNTATFDGDGRLWFTGQNGFYGRLDPESGALETFPAPNGRGPYGIATTPDGEVVYGSLAGSYLGLIDRETDEVTVVDTPTAGGGARRVWADSAGGLWITEWFAGKIARYDPGAGTWQEWDLPGDAQPYAVYVAEDDGVWISDFGSNAMLRFDPGTETFISLVHDSDPASVRQLLGRPGEVWGAESSADRLMVVQFGG